MARIVSITLAILVGFVFVAGSAFVQDDVVLGEGGKKKGKNKKNPKGSNELQKLRLENQQLKQAVNQLIALIKQRDKFIQQLQKGGKKKKGKGKGKNDDADTQKLVQIINQQQIAIAQLTAQLGRVKTGAPAAKIPNPPTKEVKGKITKINADDLSVLTVDVGSDAGLKKGNTLEVFRGSETPVFLGLMILDSVRADSATGRLLRNDPASPLRAQVGDGAAGIMPRE